jgi:CO/xanthine dehydrogenase Mo-binding subunit
MRSITAADEVAAVAAVDEETAAEAAELIKVDYEPTAPLVSIEEATAHGAPVLHAYFEDNYADDLTMSFGDIEKAFSEADKFRPVRSGVTSR